MQKFKKGDLVKVRGTKRPMVFLLLDESIYSGFHKAMKPNGKTVLINLNGCELAVAS